MGGGWRLAKSGDMSQLPLPSTTTMSDAPDGTVSQGPINKKRKADLLVISSALGISLSDPPPIVPKLISIIKKHLKDRSAELSVDPRFQGLYVYRAQAPQSGRSKETGVVT